MTYMTDIEKFTDIEIGEKIEIVVIGECSNRKDIPYTMLNSPRKWEDIKHLLDYECNYTSGLPTIHPIYAYTKNHIIFISEYDGSTAFKSLPRNPSYGEVKYGNW